MGLNSRESLIFRIRQQQQEEEIDFLIHISKRFKEEEEEFTIAVSI